MYNGIGLQSPRGSGTSGHVQASKFLAKPRPPSSAAAGGGGIPTPPLTGSGIDGARKSSKDILEHDRKRQVELRLLVLRDELEEQGYTEAEIEERVEEARKAAEIDAATPTPAAAARVTGQGGLQSTIAFCRSEIAAWFRITDTHGHHAAARKENQLQTMRTALGLDAEDVQKKGAVVEIDVESGELVQEKMEKDSQQDL